jgi:hypothetical protein
LAQARARAYCLTSLKIRLRQPMIVKRAQIHVDFQQLIQHRWHYFGIEHRLDHRQTDVARTNASYQSHQ